jgi:uncharacterized membrane protein
MQETTKVSAEHSETYARLFGITFIVSFIVATLASPFLIQDRNGDDYGLGVSVIILIGAFTFGPVLFLKAAFFAAATFFPLYYFGCRFVKERASFLGSVLISAFVSSTFAFAFHVEFSPFRTTFDLDRWWLYGQVGVIAMVVSGAFAVLQVLAVSKDV